MIRIALLVMVVVGLACGVARADMLLTGAGATFSLPEPSGLIQLEGGTDIMLYENSDRAKLEG